MKTLVLAALACVSAAFQVEPLLESSHLYEEAQHRLSDHGINVGGVELKLDVMMARKEKIVDTLTGGIDMLFKKRGVTAYRGRGKLQSAESIEITPGEGADAEQPTLISADQILLCPGSIPARLPSIEEDGDRIGNSTTALSYPEVPEVLVVIGGGYIGLELGSVWNRLGSRVIVLEAFDRILPGLDGEMASLAHRSFKKQGIEFRTGTMVTSAAVDPSQSKPCTVEIQGGEPIYCDRVLLATGRWPATDDLGLAAIGVQMDRRGYIEVKEDYQTSVPGVYAIGDCIGGAMLAHKAMEEGIVCVERMAGIAARGELRRDPCGRLHTS